VPNIPVLEQKLLKVRFLNRFCLSEFDSLLSFGKLEICRDETAVAFKGLINVLLWELYLSLNFA
jgi:hypothetical protein